MHLFKEFKSFGDMKTPLWVPLPIETKMSIFLHQFSSKEIKNDLQISFMLVLMIEQHDSNLKRIRDTDNKFEIFLNNLIYEKYIGL